MPGPFAVLHTSVSASGVSISGGGLNADLSGVVASVVISITGSVYVADVQCVVGGVQNRIVLTTVANQAARLSVNNIQLADGIATVVNIGDLVRLEVDVVPGNTAIDIAVKSFVANNMLSVVSEQDHIPNRVIFSSLQNTRVGKTYTSSNVLIEELANNSSATLFVSNPRWGITVNGITYFQNRSQQQFGCCSDPSLALGSGVLVQNGDIVSITGPAPGVQGIPSTVNLLYKVDNAVPQVLGSLVLNNFATNIDAVVNPGPKFIQTDVDFSTNNSGTKFLAQSAWTVEPDCATFSLPLNDFKTVNYATHSLERFTPYVVATTNIFVEAAGKSFIKHSTAGTEVLINDFTSSISVPQSTDTQYGANLIALPTEFQPEFYKPIAVSDVQAEINFLKDIGLNAVETDAFYIRNRQLAVNEIPSLFIKNVENAVSEIDALCIRNIENSYTDADIIFVSTPQSCLVVPPQPYIYTRNSIAVAAITECIKISASHVESEVCQNVRHTYNLQEAPRIEFIEHRCSLIPTAEKAAVSWHTVWEYTKFEPAVEEGAYATMQQAIDAGHLAGHLNVFAYPIGRFYMWATTDVALAVGCGQPIIRSSIPVPDKWYVQGG